MNSLYSLSTERWPVVRPVSPEQISVEWDEQK
jgi:hypothetical protein